MSREKYLWTHSRVVIASNNSQKSINVCEKCEVSGSGVLQIDIDSLYSLPIEIL